MQVHRQLSSNRQSDIVGIGGYTHTGVAEEEVEPPKCFFVASKRLRMASSSPTSVGTTRVRAIGPRQTRGLFQ